MCSAEKYQIVEETLRQHGYKSSSIIAVLQDIQNEFRYLPSDILSYIAKKLKISEARVYSVATFYENFSLEPKGEHIIKICDGTACHVRKSIPILNALRKELGLSESKHTTDDKMFTLETVSCLGACGLAPVITIDEKVYSKMTPESTLSLIKDIKEGKV